MTILDKIISHKRSEVAARKQQIGISSFMMEDYFKRDGLSLRDALMADGASGIIAEFKRRSPSKGDINTTASLFKVNKAYAEAGACGISVLTDTEFFGGTLKDLYEARTWGTMPVLRKDFMVDRYQLFEAKAYGADVILLIAAALTHTEVRDLAAEAKQLKLEVLFEIHSEDELDKLTPDIDMVGVNNRNLKDFTVSVQRSIDLVHKIPNEFVKVSESGISSPDTVKALRELGYKGFLMGENFMKTTDPGQAAKEFIAML